MKSVVIGGGAAGFFGAIVLKALCKNGDVILLEKTRQPLAKVKVSGGGRCNVTHHCYEVPKLLKAYPRGSKELLGAFHRFQPKEMIEWLENRGISLKAEADGRMFPVTNSSQTIIDCFLKEANTLGVNLCLNADVVGLSKEGASWNIHLTSSDILKADHVLIATGSSQKAHSLLQQLGHTIQAPVPSLFTLTIEDDLLVGLAGVSISDAKLEAFGFTQRGPLLITHWGLSGPATLKLSAWAARELAAVSYQANVLVNWLPAYSEDQLKALLLEKRSTLAKHQISAEPLGGLARQLWKNLVEKAGIETTRTYAHMTKQEMNQLIAQLLRTSFAVKGKSTNKEEFVTCGGVLLNEVDFRRMESKKHRGLHFAGEVLDIDGITGGYNFQSAWTTAWIAAHAIAEGYVPSEV
jgi:predicted Rossmann fold flavoprotein